MNLTDYETFEARLFDAFPTLIEFMQKNGEGTRGLWMKAMRSPKLDDALDAIDAIFCGSEEYPKANAGFPRAVCRICRDATNKRAAAKSTRRFNYVDGDPTYRCWTCQDSGQVEVVHPLTVKAAVSDGRAFLDTGTLYSAVAACDCDAGDRWASSMNLVRFRAETMPRWGDLSDAGGDVPVGSLASAVKAALGDGARKINAAKDHTKSLAFERKCRLLEWLDERGIRLAAQQQEF